MTSSHLPSAAGPSAIARHFVEARQSAQFLPEFPGAFPNDLATGYATQDAAISLWPDDVVGWKIGRMPPEFEAKLRAPRIAGPVFRRQLWTVGAGETDVVTPFPVFVGGFAAVEAEYVVRVGHDAPAGKVDWTLEEALAITASLHIGMEPAGSPLATINKLGPTVVVSDFGNNNGLILGPEIHGWRGMAWEDLACETWIEGTRVGTGTAASIPGGPIEALRFLLEHLARRNRPLKAGDLVTTGAATGIHDITAGQSAVVRFGPCGELRCKAVQAKQANGDKADDHRSHGSYGQPA